MKRVFSIAVAILFGSAELASGQRTGNLFLNLGGANVTSPDLERSGELAVSLGGERWIAESWGLRAEGGVLMRTASSECTIASAACSRSVPGTVAVGSLGVAGRMTAGLFAAHPLRAAVGAGIAHATTLATLRGGTGLAFVGDLSIDLYNGRQLAVPLSAQSVLVPSIGGYQLRVWSLLLGIRRSR